ncbi:MAG: DUF5056 domain-containing protein [Prevotella sp.]|nr:DUF5056 domain-containing protein [Prevotella sp.]MBQ8488011.1 DUF5056 domain-containing protein [Prevotella sp.]
MDMTDNELLDRFFETARQMEIADDGFTERVMRRVPSRNTQTLSRLWTVFCVALGVLLFVLLRGWEVMAYGLLMLVNTPPTHQQLLMFAASAGVIGVLAIVELLGRERYSML